MKRVVFMFPGQGSQAVGMGKEIHDTYPDIQSLYERANEAVTKDLRQLMFTGPADALTETENAQPALLLSSIALQQLLAQEGVEPVATVGHSLGEYSALVAAGSISIEEALPLVATRGKLMEESFPKGQGSMSAVLGLSQQEITEALKGLPADEIVDVANLNCPGQIVISGTKTGLELAEPLLTEAGARRVIQLNVSGPFHSRLMKAASEKFAESLERVHISDATLLVYANVTAKPITDHTEIKDLLIKQLYSPVQFETSIRNIQDMNIDAFVEIGNGKVLCGLVKKIDRKVKTFSIQDPVSLEKFLNWYKEEQ